MSQVGHSSAQRRFDTTLPMALATLLIVNSHLESFYPLRWLAGDGLLGNYLFFLLSGLRMAASRGIKDDFLSFFKARILRIYPAVWLAALCIVLVKGLPDSLSEFVRVYIWPTDFTYVALIMPFYAGYYWMYRIEAKIEPARWCMFLGLFWVVAVNFVRTPMHAFSDVPQVVHVTDYFIVFMLGVFFQRSAQARNLSVSALLFLLSWLAYFTVKLAVMKMSFFSQYWLVHLLGVSAACSTFLFLGRSQWTVLHGVPKKLACFLADHSLEIYVTHSTLIQVLNLQRMAFPLNIITLCALTIMSAWSLRKVTSIFLERSTTSR
jgi:peptidoglycan/LPS O-acetylase OafA/YrhL